MEVKPGSLVTQDTEEQVRELSSVSQTERGVAVYHSAPVCPFLLTKLPINIPMSLHILQLKNVYNSELNFFQYLYLPLFAGVSCGDPGVPANGAIVQQAPSYLFESSLSFTCDRKYRLVGASRITCQENGDWSAPPPVCEGKM